MCAVAFGERRGGAGRRVALFFDYLLNAQCSAACRARNGGQDKRRTAAVEPGSEQSMAELLGLDQLVANDQLVSNHDISSGKSQSQPFCRMFVSQSRRITRLSRSLSLRLAFCRIFASQSRRITRLASRSLSLRLAFYSSTRAPQQQHQTTASTPVNHDTSRGYIVVAVSVCD